MKNRALLIFLFIDCLIAGGHSNAQTLKNRLNFGVNYELGNFHGEEFFKIENSNIKFPAFYSNFENVQGYSIFSEFAVNKFLYFGLTGGTISASGWKLLSQIEYDLANANIRYLAPYVQFITPQRQTGFWNRARVFVSISPTFGFSEINSVFYLPHLNYEGISFLETKTDALDRFNGVGLGFGVTYYIGHEWGFRSEYSISNLQTGSNLTLDDHMKLSKISVGIFKRFLKDKRFYR
jgi:hypothetical protein